MKRSLLILAAVAAIGFTSCKNNNKASDKMQNDKTAEEVTASNKDNTMDNANKKYPKIKFDEKNFDFGSMKEGDVVQHKFTFTNTGDAPLKVLKARPSCGCTVPSWSKEPIAPGEKGSMMVKFNSRGKHGRQHKSVRLTTNTKKGKEVLRFSANVNKKGKK